MGRADRRAAASDRRRAGNASRRAAKSPTHAHLVALAKDYASDGFEGDEPDFALPGFDAALAELSATLDEVLEGDLSDFVCYLRGMAREAEVESLTNDDEGAWVRATLFLLPLEGNPEAAKAALADDGTLSRLARLPKAVGVAHPDSHVFLSRTYLSLAQMVEAGPARIAGAAKAFADIFGGGELDVDKAAALDGHLARSFPPPKAELGGAYILKGALVGVRVVPEDGWGDGATDLIDGYAGPDVEDDPEGDAEVETLAAFAADWAVEADGLIHGVTVGMPCEFGEAIDGFVGGELMQAFDGERNARGMDLAGGAFSVLVGRDSASVTLSQDGAKLGPVPVPLVLFERDPEAFLGALEGASTGEATVAWGEASIDKATRH